MATIQGKLAFLLGVTCFLRPSVLHRIPFNSVSLNPTAQTIYFEVHCPKEKRKRRSIIKSFLVRAHSQATLCPISVFTAFCTRRASTAPNRLFINSHHAGSPISVRTIQGWLRRLLRFSTTESRVSLRSIASSLALQAGIPKEDIVTMGNWSSSQTFEHHYRREHLSTFDFTNTLVPPGDMVFDDDEYA
ncbi:hypothetical protein G6F46_007803 [Rhizopus delemar]|uniref:Tyr recombinase domain-containing protein n=2 Tax=Rhizopus TaxID=4842 RepID=A0A9P7CMZ4_9FUNG|nr:hypothetical protein G6F55_006747 [Rhizopus delemar]KAG1541130.1 hypothetical protein G6F51_008088 [Rhizopus arrhizus]KAG1495216.1 hypothetical protein G6F54_007328 [Rhizopus delemar]KAG1509285.1 hypothetical protein G6F53_007564 [Rhizopus delemar]KAG1521029.1 hypothetical protein G6F52_007112 [Rhizopus delemar]